MLLIISRYLAILFAIVNILAIFPVGMLGFVFAFRIGTTLGIDSGVAVAIGLLGMIVAIAVINGFAAVVVCILDRLTVLTGGGQSVRPSTSGPRPPRFD